MQYLLLATGLILLLAGLAGAGGEWPRLGMSAIFAGLGLTGCGISVWRKKRVARIDYDKLQGWDTEKIELMNAAYEKGRQDLQFIETVRRELQDKELAQKLGGMQQTASNLLKYLQRNPQKLPQAQKFIDYYQDRAAVLVGKYRDFESMELTTPEMDRMREKLKESIDELEIAYNGQFERVLRDQFIDMNAEMAVIHQAVNMEGGKRPSQNDQNAAAPEVDTNLADLSVPRRQWHAAKASGQMSLIPPEQKSDVIMTKLIQSALAIFLGGFGAHKFYQGKTLQGVLYCLFFWTVLPEFIGFCEGIRYLVMKLDDFYIDYYLPRQK